jgi:hypothetical protein
MYHFDQLSLFRFSHSTITVVLVVLSIDFGLSKAVCGVIRSYYTHGDRDVDVI